MWLRLGNDEIINLDHITSIKRVGKHTLEIRYLDPNATRTIQFETEAHCHAAFEKMIENLVSLNEAME